VPIVLIAATEDSLCTKQDTETLYEILREANSDVKLSFIEGLGHSDIIRGKNLDHIAKIVLPTLLKTADAHISVLERKNTKLEDLVGYAKNLVQSYTDYLF